MTDFDWIGHPDARRRQTAEGWEYQDRKNQVFAEGLHFFGLSLPLADAHIERLELEGNQKGAKLMRSNRRQALQNMDAFDFSMRLIEAILIDAERTKADAEIAKQKAEKQEAWTLVQKVQKGTPKALTAEQEAEVLRLHTAKESVSSIAKRFGVSRPTIDKVIKAKAQSLDKVWR